MDEITSTTPTSVQCGGHLFITFTLATHFLPTSTAFHAHDASSPIHQPKDLWVDRYRPRQFIDLTGDERVNREVLAWVKEWDPCVFGKNKSKAIKRKRAEAVDVSVAEVHQRADAWNRPREKVCLYWAPASTVSSDVLTDPPNIRPSWTGKDNSRSCRGETVRLRSARGQRKVHHPSG
jgi:hypothetical protein